MSLEIKQYKEFPLWCIGIGSMSAMLGHRFDSWPGTVGWVSGVATAMVAQILSLAQELHVLQGGKKKKKEYKNNTRIQE